MGVPPFETLLSLVWTEETLIGKTDGTIDNNSFINNFPKINNVFRPEKTDPKLLVKS